MDYMIDIQALKSLTRGNDILLKKIGRLEKIKQEDITGLINHLETFANTKVGSYITDNNAVKLSEVINSGGVIYFALPALQYPELAPGLGKLVINDIKNTIYNCQQKVFIVFDEFSIFAGNQVLNILNGVAGAFMAKFTVLSQKKLRKRSFLLTFSFFIIKNFSLYGPKETNTVNISK